MKPSYDVHSIIEMSQLDHIRKNSGMYIGDAENPNSLCNEILDNALDEVQAGFANIVGVFINTKENTIKILENGRGFPYDQSLPLDKDPPVLAATKLFTSGKFKKGENGSAYDISIGLHGVGMCAVFALSEWLHIDIYRNKKHATYKFTHDGDITRHEEDFTGAMQPYSTKVEFKPSKKYFSTTSVDIEQIKERLLIAAGNYPNLKIAFRIDAENMVISGSENELILDHIGKNITEWVDIRLKKNRETCNVKIAWDTEPPTSPKIFTTVNLVKVNEGSHVNLVLNSLKKYLGSYIGKLQSDGVKKYNFQLSDILVGIRLYINLKIVKASFAEQTKKKLSTQSDLSVMNSFDSELENYFKENKEKLTELLDSFQEYRNAITNKKLVGSNISSSGKRGMTSLIKLRDCTQPNGELFIGEGDSAVGGLIQVRDPKKHAILPLRGVVPNAITNQEFAKNKELKDIIIACGCGIDSHCDIDKLRYSKVILAADADPAGSWITALLITLFAYKMAPVIKAGRLYVCETPLFGYKEKNQFYPLWTEENLEKARASGKRILRFKGLGEFPPKDLKVFTLDEGTRRLTQVKWSQNNSEQLFELMSKSEERKKLVMGEWKLGE